LLCSEVVILLAAQQIADVPLGYFMLVTLVLLALHDRFYPGSNGLLAVAGCAAGLAAWTKNEGLLFALLVIVVRGVFTACTSRRIMWKRQMVLLLAGLLPVLLVLIWFKSQIPPSELLAKQSGNEMLARLMDIERYRVIAVNFVRTVIHFGPSALPCRPWFFSAWPSAMHSFA